MMTSKDEYPSLNFEIFKLNSETNILPFMRGLYESEFVSDKLYIGIYDNDGAGKNTLDNRKNFDAIEGVSFKKIIENQKQNNSYFVCALPKPESVNCDCTIETMFESYKFEEAYKLAFNNALGHFSNKSIDSIADNIKEQAKNILSENSKNFVKEDFKYFRKLFDLINEIKKYNEKSKLEKNKEVKVVEKVSDKEEKSDDLSKTTIKTTKMDVNDAVKPVKELVKNRDYVIAENGLLRKTNPELRKMFLRIQKLLISNIKGLSFSARKYYISIKVKRNFAYFYFTGNKVKLIVMKDYKTVDDKITNHIVGALSKSVQGFYGSPCAEILITENNNLDEIINLLVEIQK